MIIVNGYKAFRGVMNIQTKPYSKEHLEVDGDWLYIPQDDCWVCNGFSYPSEICTPQEKYNIELGDTIYYYEQGYIHKTRVFAKGKRKFFCEDIKSAEYDDFNKEWFVDFERACKKALKDTKNATIEKIFEKLWYVKELHDENKGN